MNPENNAFQLMSTALPHLTNIIAARAEGVYIYDDDGQQYTDFTSGIGVLSTGHCHPNVVQAIKDQAGTLIFGQVNCVLAPPVLSLLEKLYMVTPDHMNSFFLATTGAEAVEIAVKTAKVATGRTNMIVFQGSFHGRTHLTMSMTTSKYIYRHKYQPLVPGIFVAPYPYVHYYGWSEEETVEFCKQQLEYIFKGQTSPAETAAIVIEPILGEGGYVPCPPAFLKHLRSVCDAHGILLIVDEIQSGFGRTGTMWAFEHTEIEPDILIMAKGMGSGLPISAIATTKEIMATCKPGTHGGTYNGGSAIGAAAACATLDTILDDDLMENASLRGQQLLNGLRELRKDFSCIGDVRGMGLMVGVEFNKSDGRPDEEMCRLVQQDCIDNKLLILSCGTFKNVLRWVPPLIVTEGQIDEALQIFKNALQIANS